MTEVTRSGKIPRTVSREEASLAVSEVSTSLQAENDDLVICFSGPNQEPEKLNGIHINQTFSGIAVGSMS